jgi:glycosidase
VVDRSYSPEHVNASQQRNDPGSMLHFMRRLIERYRASAEIGWGSLTVLEQPDHTVLAHSLAGAEGRMIALHNLGEESASVTIRVDGCGEGDELADLLVDGALVPVSADGTVTIALDGYGYRWFRVREHGTQRLR